jgi:hypothetical protein
MELRSVEAIVGALNAAGRRELDRLMDARLSLREKSSGFRTWKPSMSGSSRPESSGSARLMRVEPQTADSKFFS